MTPRTSQHSNFYHCESVCGSDFPVSKPRMGCSAGSAHKAPSPQCHKFEAALGHRMALARQVFPDLPDRGAELALDLWPNLREHEDTSYLKDHNRILLERPLGKLASLGQCRLQGEHK